MTPEGALWGGGPVADRALAVARAKLTGLRGQWFALLIAVWIATLGAMLAGAALDQPVLAAVPLVAVAVLVAIVKAPLRYTLMALVFLALTLENPAERPGNGQWKSPLYVVGALLMANWNTTIPIRALKFSGMDLLTGLLFAVWLYRRVMGRREVPDDTPETARPLTKFALVSFCTVVGLMGYGIATRGDFTNALWQTQKLLYVPIMFALMSATFRGPRDHRLIGGLVIAAATVKALLAIYIRAVLGPEPPYVTTHADSLLFATAYSIPLARLLIAADKKSLKLCLMVLPVLTAGMIANNRRLVWVEVTIGVVIVLMMTPWTPLKRALVRGLVLIMPLMPVYLAAGWNSGSAIFKPVKTFRSIADSKSDRSTETRDIENFNLIWTLKHYSFVPMGFGHEYIELVQADDISQFFPQYRFIPHNSVLALWAFAGVLGFTGIWMVLGVAVFMAARAYRKTRDVDHQTAALSCIVAVFIYLMQAYGDMGLVNWNGVFIIASAMVVAGKLAIATGAYPSRRGYAVAVAAPAPQPVPVVTYASQPRTTIAPLPQPVTVLAPLPQPVTVMASYPQPVTSFGPPPRPSTVIATAPEPVTAPGAQHPTLIESFPVLPGDGEANE